MKLCFLALLAFPVSAAAQVPAVPTSVIVFEVDPGRMRTGTTSAPRTDANAAFDYRINDAATLVPAVKHVPCVPFTTAPLLTCQLRLPMLPEGTHSIQVSGRPSPAEPGVAAGPFSAPLSLALVVVVAPGQPTSVRIVTP
jgi:hypothetical protein